MPPPALAFITIMLLNQKIPLWLGWFLACVLLMASHSADAKPPVPASVATESAVVAPVPAAAGKGFLESAELSHGVLTLTGWAAPNNPSVFVTMATVWLGEREIYRGRLGYLLNRPDVVQATGQALWLSSGIVLPLRVPGDLVAGPQTLRIRITNGDGSTFDLGEGTKGAMQVAVPESVRQPSLRSRVMWWLAVILPLAVLAFAFVSSSSSSAATTSSSGPSIRARWFALSVVASFVLLVAGGWSGSSLPLLLERAGILQHDAASYLGKPQEVRRDEWLIVTPLAASQAMQAAERPFASVNTLHGVHGQNMNVVGMTGAPTWGWEQIAKPASWGFLAFDLKRALAWYWWFPFFACFLALWVLLRQWFAMDWRRAALLAVLAPASAYSVAWSGWPAYVSFFPVLAALALVNILRSTGALAAALYGVVLGWAVAGFVLVLYPGWQIPLGYLMLIVTLGQVWQHRASLNWRWMQLIGLLCAALVAMLALGSWWLDSRDAIAALSQTVYPGQRSMELGGYVEPWHLAKGLINLVTMYESSQWSIPSDAAGNLYLLLPMLIASLALMWRERRVTAWVLALWLYVGFMLISLFVGIPAWLAQISLWGKVPAFRLDVALGLAQIFLLAWLMSAAEARTRGSLWGAAIVGAAFAWLNWSQLNQMPVPMQDWITPAVMLLVIAASGVLGFMVVRGQWFRVVVITVIWTLAVSLPFNPVAQAPAQLRLVDGLNDALHQPVNGHAPRVAVINDDLWMGALPMAGVGVVNSVFYDPPLQFWRELDPTRTHENIYNRYQNFLIKLVPQLDAAAEFRITSPRMDAVVLEVQPERFDFAKLSADYVLARPADAEQLKANPRLELAKTDDRSWWLFRVNPTNRLNAAPQ